MTRRYTIRQAVAATGLEECEIRFFEQVFREYLTFSRLDLENNEFTQDHIDILCRIKHLIHAERRSLHDVKRELREALEVSSRSEASGETVARPVRPASVIAVTSGKGGVGKTTISINLAVAFARQGLRVAIFDADLGLANVHILMGLKPRFNVKNLVEDNFRLEDVLTEGPLGIKLISGGQGVRELANLTPRQRRWVLREIDRLEREVDVLIVDTGAGISDNVLRFATYADDVMVVTTPNIAAAADAYSIIKIILGMEAGSRIGLIANMARSPEHGRQVFRRIDGAVRKYLNYELTDWGAVAADDYVEAASMQRQAMQLLYPDCPAARCIGALAQRLANDRAAVRERREGSFGDMMGTLKRVRVGV